MPPKRNRYGLIDTGNRLFNSGAAAYAGYKRLRDTVDKMVSTRKKPKYGHSYTVTKTKKKKKKNWIKDDHGAKHINHRVTYKKSKKARGIQAVGNQCLIKTFGTGMAKAGYNLQSANVVLSINTNTILDAYIKAFNGTPSIAFGEKPLFLKTIAFSTEFTNAGTNDIEIDVYWGIHKDTQQTSVARTITDYWNAGLAYERGNDASADTLNQPFQRAENVKEVRRRYWLKRWTTKLEGGEKRTVNIVHNTNRNITHSHLLENIFIRGITSEMMVVVRGTLAGYTTAAEPDAYNSTTVCLPRSKIMFMSNLRIQCTPLSAFPRTNQTTVTGLSAVISTDKVGDIDVDGDIINVAGTAAFV